MWWYVLGGLLVLALVAATVHAWGKPPDEDDGDPDRHLI